MELLMRIERCLRPAHFGPTRDGRIKPDVVASGEGVAAAISQAIAPHARPVRLDCGGIDPALIVCAYSISDEQRR